MNFNRTILAGIITVSGVVSVLCLFAYYTALHDIQRDYASAAVLQQYASGAGSLPEWTSCALEWKVVEICFWPMVIFHGIFLAGVIADRICRKK